MLKTASWMMVFVFLIDFSVFYVCFGSFVVFV